jgi:hypothetical protein
MKIISVSFQDIPVHIKQKLAFYVLTIFLVGSTVSFFYPAPLTYLNPPYTPRLSCRQYSFLTAKLPAGWMRAPPRSLGGRPSMRRLPPDCPSLMPLVLHIPHSVTTRARLISHCNRHRRALCDDGMSRRRGEGHDGMSRLGRSWRDVPPPGGSPAEIWNVISEGCSAASVSLSVVIFLRLRLADLSYFCFRLVLQKFLCGFFSTVYAEDYSISQIELQKNFSGHKAV